MCRGGGAGNLDIAKKCGSGQGQGLNWACSQKIIPAGLVDFSCSQEGRVLGPSPEYLGTRPNQPIVCSSVPNCMWPQGGAKDLGKA